MGAVQGGLVVFGKGGLCGSRRVGRVVKLVGLLGLVRGVERALGAVGGGAVGRGLA